MLHGMPLLLLVRVQRRTAHGQNIVLRPTVALVSFLPDTWRRRLNKFDWLIVVPYPFLTENTFPIRVGIYAGASVVAYASFRLLNELHG